MDREPVIGRVELGEKRPVVTPEERRARRSTAMIRFGGLALIVAFLAVGSGAPIGFLIGLLGVALFVGGLIVRP